eukprot:Rhum_TRINITY_DN19164_c0_g1::Rhum_TRINITY_DN19164_c0_g1_i1::g.169412::m.169412
MYLCVTSNPTNGERQHKFCLCVGFYVQHLGKGLGRKRGSAHRRRVVTVARLLVREDVDEFLRQLRDGLLQLLQLCLDRLLALYFVACVQRERQAQVLAVCRLPLLSELRNQVVPLLVRHLAHRVCVSVRRVRRHRVFVLVVHVLLDLLQVGRWLPEGLRLRVPYRGSLRSLRLHHDVVDCVADDKVLLRHKPHHRLLRPLRHTRLLLRARRLSHRRKAGPARVVRGVAGATSAALPLLEEVRRVRVDADRPHRCCGLPFPRRVRHVLAVAVRLQAVEALRAKGGVARRKRALVAALVHGRPVCLSDFLRHQAVDALLFRLVVPRHGCCCASSCPTVWNPCPLPMKYRYCSFYNR